MNLFTAQILFTVIIILLIVALGCLYADD